MRKDRLVYAKLDRDEFIKRTQDIFPAYYQTIVSVIQGVTLGLFISNLKNGYDLASDKLVFIVYAATTFLYIAVVTFEYATISGIFRWSQTAFDTLIPLGLGVAQSLPCIALGSSNNMCYWWLFISILAFLGIIAYHNALTHAIRVSFKEGTQGEEAFQLGMKIIKKKMFLLAALFVLAVLVFAYNYLSTLKDKDTAFHYVLLAPVIFLLALFLWMEQRFYKKMHETYGLDYK